MGFTVEKAMLFQPYMFWSGPVKVQTSTPPKNDLKRELHAMHATKNIAELN